MSSVNPLGESASLHMALKALLNCSTGSIEQIAREALEAVAAFVQDQGGDIRQGGKSDTGNLSTPASFGEAAKVEFAHLAKYRADCEAREAKRAAKKSAKKKARK